MLLSINQYEEILIKRTQCRLQRAGVCAAFVLLVFVSACANRAVDNAGFAWTVDLAVREGSSSQFVKGRTNQVAAAGSGFQFSIKTKNPPGALRTAIGFNSVCAFTAEADNRGTETYNALLNVITDREQPEGGLVIPESTVLTDLGIGVYTR